MESSAYILNQQFIDDLWNRIKSSDTTFTPFDIFDLQPPRGIIPSREHLEILLDAVYWSSYQKEEGAVVSLSIIFRKPEHGGDTFCFDRPIRLSSKSLVKLGPALENPRSHISVWPDEHGQLKIWGFRTATDDFITYDLRIQVLGVGRVLISFDGRCLAALTGSRSVFIDPGILMKMILPKITSSVTPDASDLQIMLRYNALLFIAQSMRIHGHGGTVLVVQDGSDWRKSIRHPVPYTGGATFLDTALSELHNQSEPPTDRKGLFDFVKKVFSKRQDRLALTREKLRQQCSRIARLTAVDGALVMTMDRYTYCFGAKIQSVDPVPPELELQVLKPIEGYSRSSLTLSDLGGTRHQSAAQFAYDQPGAVTFVASQDGDVTFFAREEQSGSLLAIQQAELALLHEGLSGALWNISLFSSMGAAEKS